MPAIRAHDAVRVITLTGPADDHLVRSTSGRVPQIGDVGVVVDVSDRLGGSGRHYTVAMNSPDGRAIWLAVFVAHELEPVIDR